MVGPAFHGMVERVDKAEISAEEFQSLTDRTVQYRYRKRTFDFALTRALFSSAGVDSGSHQLLVLLAQTIADRDVTAVVDLGCGTGTLGISAAGSWGVPLYASDRDALAVAWTRRNAERNGLQSFKTQLSLGPTVPIEESGVLVISNLPAKAGAPVLDRLLAQVAAIVARSKGYGAVVVVRPLERWLRESLADLSAAVLAERTSANHASVVFRVDRSSKDAVDHSCSTEPGPPIPSPGVDPAFIRCESCDFQGPEKSYSISTAFGIPEFDGLSFRTALVFDLLRSVTVSGTAMVRGVGQGHLAVGTLQRAPYGTRLVLSDRDLLALQITGSNASGNGAEQAHVTLSPDPLGSSDQMVDWLIVSEPPVGDRGIGRWTSFVTSSLAVEGKLILAGRSAHVARFEKLNTRTLRAMGERRMHGERVQLFVRKR